MAAWPDHTGRWTLSLIWCAASALVLVSMFLGARSSGAGSQAYGDHATYYVVAHNHYALSLAAAFGVFAIAYLILGALDLTPRWLGYVHITLMIVGVGLVLAPQYLIRSGLPRRGADVDPVALFAQLNRLSSAGYLVMLLGLLTFVAVLAEAAWKFWQRRSG